MLALAAATAAATLCPGKSVGPGSLQRGGDAGAACIAAAFEHRCRAATYTLSQFGVDTIHSLTFRTERRTTGCAVVVTESFRVVPQQPRVTGRFVCLRLRALVADRCTPARTISLTKL